MNVKDNRTNQAKDLTDSIGASQTDALRPGAMQSAQALRKHAEGTLRERMSFSLEDLEGMSPEETRRMLYELQVQQIELEVQNEELQNEELRRTQAEEALQQQTAALVAAHAKMEHEQRLLAAVMEALPIGVAITDPLGGTIQTNTAYERIWGGPRPATRSIEDYTAYKAWRDDTGTPVAPEEWASALAIRKGEVTVGQMIRLQRFDGSEIFVLNSASPVYDSEGNIVGSAVAIQDVTELKRAEQALLENREDFARAQEVGSIGSWRLDVRQNILTWSDENHRIFGVPKGTPLGYEDFLAIVHPEDRAYVDTQWQAGLRGEPYDIEHRIVVHGQIKWVREKAYLEFDKDSTLTGGFGITQDITKRKLTEELIKQQVEELLTINEDMEKFNNAAVGRELRMIELKQEINELCRQAGQPSRYPLDFDEDRACLP